MFKNPGKNYGIDSRKTRFGADGPGFGLNTRRQNKPARSDFGLSDAPPTPEQFGLTPDLVSDWSAVQANPQAPKQPNVIRESAGLFFRVLGFFVAAGALIGIAALLESPKLWFLVLVVAGPLLVAWALGNRSDVQDEHAKRLYKAHMVVRGLEPGMVDQIRLYERAEARYQKNLETYNQATREYQESQRREARKNRAWWLGLSGTEFEAQLGLLFHASGWHVEETPATADGGVDLVLTKNRERVVVQCKAHKSPVAIGTARELAAARMDFKADKAILAALGGVTGPVRDYVEAKPIEIMTIDEVLEMARATPGAWR